MDALYNTFNIISIVRIQSIDAGIRLAFDVTCLAWKNPKSLVMELNYDQTSFNTVLITVLELPSLPWLGYAAIANDNIVFVRKSLCFGL